MNRNLQIAKYVVFDYLSALVAWFLFYYYRKKISEPRQFGYEVPFEIDDKLILGLILLPLFWLIFYTLTGNYKNIYRKYRLKELSQTFWWCLVGTIIIFFTIILDDVITNYQDYYRSFLVLFALHFGFTFFFRFILTSRTVSRIHRGKIGFKTIIIGGGENALSAYDEITKLKKSPGHIFIGFLKINGGSYPLMDKIPLLGDFSEVHEIIKQENIEEVIIAIESHEHRDIGNIITDLEGENVQVKISPDIYDILAGSVKMTSIFGAPLIEIHPQIMPPWQFSLKRIMDISCSLVALLLLSPVFLILAIMVRLSSTGQIIFKQERIGWHNKPFFIYKFRTMFSDAEKSGPMLSKEDDSRITKIGLWLRRTRLDELPQFFNVLKGEMSLVGPRPERQFFIDKIMVSAPHFRHLQKVKPGITSWGQVKYGYAENVDQMIQRLKFDLIYIENMSLALDLKIIAYTILTIVKGKGK